MVTTTKTEVVTICRTRPSDVTGLTRDADRRLRAFAKHLETLTPFWRELAKHLADESQRALAAASTYRTRSESR